MRAVCAACVDGYARADRRIWEGGSVRLAATTSREVSRLLAAEHQVVPVTRKVLADSETLIIPTANSPPISRAFC